MCFVRDSSNNYEPVNYLPLDHKLLNPITTNEFTVKDSFDAVTHINNNPRSFFNDGYRFVSFVTSLFPNIPLKQTVNIILKRKYKNNLISATLKKRTLKVLLKRNFHILFFTIIRFSTFY